MKKIMAAVLALVFVVGTIPWAWAGGEPEQWPPGSFPRTTYTLGPGHIDEGRLYKVPGYSALESYYWSLESLAGYMGIWYPRKEIIHIEGKPWQLADPKWRDLIYETLRKYGDSKFWDDTLYQVIRHPVTAGRGQEVWELYRKGLSADEIVRVLIARHGDQWGALKGDAELPPPVSDPVHDPCPCCENETPCEGDEPGAVETPAAEPTVEAVLVPGRDGYVLCREGQCREEKLDAGARIVDGRTLIPLRGLLEHFGLALDWDPATRTVTVEGEAGYARLAIGARTAEVNFEEVALDVPAQLVNGRTLVPLRFLSESLGLSVKWDERTGAVHVRTS